MPKIALFYARALITNQVSDVTFYDLCGMPTKWRNVNGWLVRDDSVQVAGLRQADDSRVQRAGLRQGLGAVIAFNKANDRKRSNRIMWKDLARKDRESDGIQDIDTAANLPPNKWSGKRNRWSHANDLFRKKGGRQTLCVFEKPVSNGGGTVMLPGVGTVRVHGDMEGLDMRSFQLVETTKKTTRRTGDCDRTYRLHVQVGMEAPKPSGSAVVRGVDMGIVHSATTVDLDTGRHMFHRLDPLLFFKPAHPAFQARFRQTACSASHSNLWFTSPHTMSLMRSYVFSGFRYLSPMIRHVLTLRIACST